MLSFPIFKGHAFAAMAGTNWRNIGANWCDKEVHITADIGKNWKKLRVVAATVEIRPQSVVEDKERIRVIRSKLKGALGQAIRFTGIGTVNRIGQPSHLVMSRFIIKRGAWLPATEAVFHALVSSGISRARVGKEVVERPVASITIIITIVVTASCWI